MAANSKHWADINEWIIKTIRSCETSIQICRTKTLIERFIAMKIIPEDQSDKIIIWLYELRRLQWNRILEKDIIK